MSPGAAFRLRRGRRARLRRGVWLLAAFLVGHHVIAVFQFGVANRFFDFAHYYLYARNVIEGRSLFDLEAPRRTAEALGIRYADAPPNYPPPFYLALTPLAALPYRLAALGWLLLNELLLLAALAWRGAGRLRRNPVRMATLALVVLAFQPLYETLALGQVNLLLLAGITLTLRLWHAGSGWAGVVLGLVALVKPQFVLLGLVWLRPGDRRHLATTAVTLGAVALSSLPVLGLDAWVRYFEYLRGLPCAISLWALNLSLRALLFRLKGTCEADGFGDPLAVLSGLLGAVILAGVAFYLWRNPPEDLPARFRASGIILCAILLASPYTQEHHLTVLVLAFAGLALDPRRPRGVVQQGAWATAYLLQATAYSLVRFPAWHFGLPSLLLYGKGLGVGLLGLLLLADSGRQTSQGAALLPPLAIGVLAARAAHAILKALVIREPDAGAPLAVLAATSLWAIGLALVATRIEQPASGSRLALWVPLIAWGPLIEAIQMGRMVWVGGAASVIVWLVWRAPGLSDGDISSRTAWPAWLLSGVPALALAGFPVPLALGLLMPFVLWATVERSPGTTTEDVAWALAFGAGGARPGWFTADTVEGVLASLGRPLQGGLFLAGALLLLVSLIARRRWARGEATA